MGSTVSKDASIESRVKALGLPYSTPTSPDFNALHESFTGIQQQRRPGIIIRPQSPEDIASVVRFCVENSHPLVVRGGGHDMVGRYAADGAVSIDLRDLNRVRIAGGGDGQLQTAWVQGGTTMLQVLEALEKHGLMVPTGTCGTVGFVGWSLIGGLGQYMHSYGIGVDQIVGAKVVNAKGELVEADVKMLNGLRGGGGNMGIVAELEVKVYPLQEIQAGQIMYDSTNITHAVRTFLTNFAKLIHNDDDPHPSKFSLQPMIWLIPGLGLTLMCNLVWNGQADKEYKTWLRKVGDLAPLAKGVTSVDEAVTGMTPHAFSQRVTNHLPKKVRGASQSASLERMTDEFVDAMVACVDDLPRDGTGGFVLHVVRGDCPSCHWSSSSSIADSVCPYRDPQIHVEILGLADDDAAAQMAMAWASRTRDRLMGLEVAERRTYFPLTAPEHFDPVTMYGEEMLEELRALKREYDPDGAFRYALPSV